MLKELRLDELAPSSTNPRKTFDEAKLQELSRSIADKGVLEPLLVRPHANGNGAKYEVIAGERRYRGATLAGVETVPCIIRDLSDVEALEVQTIENLQRDDLHPLEEAEGFAALMKEAGYDVAGIAQRIGKSDQYVYDRLKLLQLIPDLQKVFLEGEITVGHAILLARLSAADQQLAMGKDRAVGYYGESGLWRANNGHVQKELGIEGMRNRQAVSVRELQTWINDHVRFDPEKADLPNLFPETEAALRAAEEEELKVVKITRDYQLKPETRAKGERTYSRRSWKRADGGLDDDGWRKPKPSKKCEHSVLGVVVAGPGRGEAFPVCIAKKKCRAHWGEEMKAKAKAGSGESSADRWKEEERRRNERWEEQHRLRQEWERAAPAVLEAAWKALKDADIMELGAFLYHEIADRKVPKKGETIVGVEGPLGAIETTDDLVRNLAALVWKGDIEHGWQYEQTAKALKKLLGVDAKRIVWPKKKTAKKSKKAPAKKAKKRAAKKAAS